MSLIYRTVADPRPIPFTVNPAATATPTVGLYDDAGLTTPHTGPAPTVSGSGTTWTYQLPATLGAGTYYALITAQTAGGTVTSTDTISVSLATIVTNTSDVTATDVADILAQRVLTRDGNSSGTFDSTTVPTDAQVTRLIAKAVAEETGGLGAIPTTLNDMLHSLVSLSTAVRVLGVYFSGDAARDDLDADLKDLRERFRQAVETIATTGDPNAVSAEDGGSGDSERPPVARGAFPSTRQDTLLQPLPMTTLYERY